ncbi:MAG: hypothetical protein B6U89_02725 [Desulfurococcales archaeon ex4484_58]|nr:MAG: hypothetical protein B6U89_02725 [Desulfurococcales archaeon ex4484_58]
MSSWVKYHFRHIANWRRYAEIIASTAKDLIGDVKVYVIGGVAEDRVTVLSDIDILIVVPDDLFRENLSVEILDKAIEKYGLPWDAPVQLHIVKRSEASKYFSRGRVIEIK